MCIRDSDYSEDLALRFFDEVQQQVQRAVEICYADAQRVFVYIRL